MLKLSGIRQRKAATTSSYVRPGVTSGVPTSGQPSPMGREEQLPLPERLTLVHGHETGHGRASGTAIRKRAT